MVADILDTVLLLALPASGKSEVRRYLDLVDSDSRVGDFHLGPTVQLDDFPYVHLMRRCDESLRAIGEPSIFFEADDQPFRDARDWGTLIELVNEDYREGAAVLVWFSMPRRVHEVHLSVVPHRTRR